jgi:hypothetical protein
VRLHYPDFHLPDLGVHVEYFGVEHDPSYDRAICDKMTAYAASRINVIPVYPCHLPHLPQYPTRELWEHANYQCPSDTTTFRVQRRCLSRRDCRI